MAEFVTIERGLGPEGRIAVVIRRAVTRDELRPIVEDIAAESPPPNGAR